MVKTSLIRGTLWRVTLPVVSSEAAISFRAEFLAPETLTLPRGGSHR